MTKSMPSFQRGLCLHHLSSYLLRIPLKNYSHDFREENEAGGYLGSHDCSQRQVEYCGRQPQQERAQGSQKPVRANEWQTEVQPCYHTFRVNKPIFSSLQLCGKALHLRCSKTMTICYESSTDIGISCHPFQLLRLLSKLHYDHFSLPVCK